MIAISHNGESQQFNNLWEGFKTVSSFAMLAGAVGAFVVAHVGNSEGPITVPPQADRIKDWPNNNQVAFAVPDGQVSEVDCGADSNIVFGSSARGKEDVTTGAGRVVVCELNGDNKPAIHWQ
jgi:hypothetical protein